MTTAVPNADPTIPRALPRLRDIPQELARLRSAVARLVVSNNWLESDLAKARAEVAERDERIRRFYRERSVEVNRLLDDRDDLSAELRIAENEAARARRLSRAVEKMRWMLLGVADSVRSELSMDELRAYLRAELYDDPDDLVSEWCEHCEARPPDHERGIEATGGCARCFGGRAIR